MAIAVQMYSYYQGGVKDLQGSQIAFKTLYCFYSAHTFNTHVTYMQVLLYMCHECTVLLDLNLILASIYSRALTLSSQQMLASKGSMFSSKGNMLSCMILLTIELDTCTQLLARMIVQSVDAPEQDCLLSCMILLTI